MKYRDSETRPQRALLSCGAPAQPAIAADKRVRARFALPHTLAAEWHVRCTSGNRWLAYEVDGNSDAVV